MKKKQKNQKQNRFHTCLLILFRVNPLIFAAYQYFLWITKNHQTRNLVHH